MKKVLMLIAMVLGTTVMVNAQTAPVKNSHAKEVKTKKGGKEAKIIKGEPAKIEGTKAKK